MLMVIFGAGASYDSSPTYGLGMAPPGTGEMAAYDDYYRPPLAKDLFANRPLFIQALELFPQCKTIVPRLRDPAVVTGQKSIEALLQEIEKEAETYARGHQELAAVRCYLQQAISQCEMQWRSITRRITNYLWLLREIERTNRGDDPVCLVTFNYDTLLEDALEDLGLMVRRMEDYVDRVCLFRVFKLHGSVNWALEVEDPLPANLNLGYAPGVLRYLIERGSGLRVSNRFALCDPSSMGVANGHPAFPALAIPVEKKQVFQCPPDVIEKLTSALPHVTKMIIIGWRATETHFLKLLRENLRPGVYLSIVAGNQHDAENIRVHIHRALLNNQPSSNPEPFGFTDFLRSRRAEQILASGPD
jgi:hypothetical protein